MILEIEKNGKKKVKIKKSEGPGKEEKKPPAPFVTIDFPANGAAITALAQVQVALGELALAEVHCRNALRLDQKNKPARKILAQIAIRRSIL